MADDVLSEASEAVRSDFRIASMAHAATLVELIQITRNAPLAEFRVATLAD